jgi:glycosyltransferase involved in cell wall biosynthesis
MTLPMTPPASQTAPAATSSAPAPRTALVALWFPKPSETFVVSEATALRDAGVPLSAHSLYGAIAEGEAMRPAGVPVEHLGLARLPRILLDFALSLATRPGRTLSLLGRTLASPGGGLEKYGENILAVFCGFSLARRFRELGVEHVHAAWANGSATAAWCAASMLGVGFSFAARARDVLPPDGLLGAKLRQADFARVESSYFLGILRPFVPDCPDKVRLIHDACLMAPGTAEAPVPMRPPIRIAAIGRFVRKKGFQHLLEAAALLKAQGLETVVTLAGDGPLRPRLEAEAKGLGIADRVRFPGFLPHRRVPELLAESDMLVMPSVRNPDGDSDGLPTVLIEALAHRVPVVATRLAGIPDLVEDGVTGLLTPEGDAQAIARAIARLAGDREAALAMAANGRARVRELFSPEHYAARMLEQLARRPR